MDYTSTVVNAPLTWQSGWIGTGIGVAVMDSGVNTDQDLNSAYVAIRPSLTTVIETRTMSMGTACTSPTIASNGTSSSCGNCTRNMTGIAPGAPGATVLLITLLGSVVSHRSADDTDKASKEFRKDTKGRENTPSE